MKFPKITHLLFFIMTLTIFLSGIAAAQEYELLEPLPCIEGGGVECPGGSGNSANKVDLNRYTQYAFNLLIAAAAIASIFRITYGGFLYMSSESFHHKKDGLGIAKNALIGLGMVLIAYTVLKTVNPKLVDLPQALIPPLKKVERTSLNFIEDYSSYEHTAKDVFDRGITMKALRDSTQNLSAQKTELESKLAAATKDGNVELATKYEGELSNIKNQINNKEGEIALLKTQNGIDLDILAYNPSLGTTGKNENFAQYLLKLKSRYETNLQALKAIDGQSDKVEKAQEYRIYGDYYLQMQNQMAIVNNVVLVREKEFKIIDVGPDVKTTAEFSALKTKSIGTVDFLLGNAKRRMKDPELISKIEGQASEIKDKISKTNLK